MLAFAESVTRAQVTAQGIDAARSAGLSITTIEDVMRVCFLFNVVNRLANASDFQWNGPGAAATGAKFLNRFAYTVPSFLLD